jgi:hypothetical protein
MSLTLAYRWDQVGSRSQALPGNALLQRLRLNISGRRSLQGSGFPGRAAEPGNQMLESE